MHRYLLAIFTAFLLIGCSNTPPTPLPVAATATQESNVAESTSAPATQENVTDDPSVTEAPAETATPEGPFPGEGPWEVSFPTADGVTLHGTVYGQGTTAVILAPMYNIGQEGWQEFAATLSTQGYRVMTFDYRGVGASEGNRDPSTAADDLQAAVDYMRANQMGRMVLIGAGLGGSAAIRVASQDNTIAGAVLISAPRIFPPESGSALEITDSELASLTMPSLWLGTRNDMTQNVEELFALAGGTDKELWIYEGSSLQGTYIFQGADANNLRQQLIDFVARVAGT